MLAIPANSCSTVTSESGDNLSLCDGNSIDSLEVKMWHKSESESVGPSCSSISMDCSADEAVFEFMRRFVSILFTDSLAITLELKHQFGQYARVSKIFFVCANVTEINLASLNLYFILIHKMNYSTTMTTKQVGSGRMWFARFVSAQRTKTKRVSETTFYALIQYFAIVLFECKECEDFLPAKHIMSLCFTFYQEVEVPGCDPYREYLFNYLRDQPIWHTLRFWNAALFYALQKDRVPKTSALSASANNEASRTMQSNAMEDAKDALLQRDERKAQPSRSISETSLTSNTSSSSSDTQHTNTTRSNDSFRLRNNIRKINRSKSSTNASGKDNSFDVDEKKLQDNTNIAFTQLG